MSDVVIGSRASFHSRTRPQEKVLYLDFDGVLMSDAVFYHPKHGPYLHAGMVADGHKLFEHAPLLEALLEPYPDLRIVLSTSWVLVLRYSKAVERLPPSLQARCVGATYHKRVMNKKLFMDLPRGQQVLGDVGRRRPSAWLAAYSTPSRTPFRSDGGQHSAVMADTVPR